MYLKRNDGKCRVLSYHARKGSNVGMVAFDSADWRAVFPSTAHNLTRK